MPWRMLQTTRVEQARGRKGMAPPLRVRLLSTMDYERLYAYRFRDLDQAARIAVWKEIAPHIHGLMASPQKVLDPAAGRGEFIAAVPARERWAVDAVEQPEADYGKGTRVLIDDAIKAKLPAAHFDGVFVSNFLEHLPSQDAIANFLERMGEVLAPGGRIAVMGPNYRYCADRYWDFADHVVALTHVAVSEHLYAAGFEPQTVEPRYLPYSFTGFLPPSPRLTAAYLKAPPLWRIFGKQFLVIAQRPSG